MGGDGLHDEDDAGLAKPAQPDRAHAALPAGGGEELMASPLIYQRLKRLARSFMAKERSGHTLQATDLVHSAYIRMFEQNKGFSENRTHFIALAATMMRRILVNHAMSHQAEKRGAGVANLTLSAAEFVDNMDKNALVDLIALDRALEKLKAVDERMVQIIELRYFSGMTIDDTADAMGVSPATVKREWNIAKLWLMMELGD